MSMCICFVGIFVIVAVESLMNILLSLSGSAKCAKMYAQTNKHPGASGFFENILHKQSTASNEMMMLTCH